MLVRLIGGLGNQMFVYAFAKSLSLKGYPILLDTTLYGYNGNDFNDNAGGGGGKNLRLLEIEKYNISLPLHNDYRAITSYLLQHDKSLYKRAMRHIIKVRFTNNYHRFYVILTSRYKHIINENGTTQNNEVLNAFLSKSIYPHAFSIGYYQNLVYFDDIYPIIREEFTLKSALSDINAKWEQRILSLPNSVFLHVRLGDYVAKEYAGGFIQLGKTYYQSAINLIKQKVSNPHIFVFSNDIEWCQKNLYNMLDFSGCGLDFVVGNDEGNAAEEMQLMRSCKHAIIANSTFSWWAAYLMDNKDKCVIMPNQILSDPNKIPHMDMLSKSGFIQIDSIWGQHRVIE